MKWHLLSGYAIDAPIHAMSAARRVTSQSTVQTGGRAVFLGFLRQHKQRQSKQRDLCRPPRARPCQLSESAARDNAASDAAWSASAIPPHLRDRFRDHLT